MLPLKPTHLCSGYGGVGKGESTPGCSTGSGVISAPSVILAIQVENSTRQSYARRLLARVHTLRSDFTLWDKARKEK